MTEDQLISLEQWASFDLSDTERSEVQALIDEVRRLRAEVSSLRAEISHLQGF